MATDVDNKSRGGTDQGDDGAPTTGADAAAALAPTPEADTPGPAGASVSRPLETVIRTPTGQGTLSRLADGLAAPFFSHRRRTMVLLSLMVLALLVYVALTQLTFGPLAPDPTVG